MKQLIFIITILLACSGSSIAMKRSPMVRFDTPSTPAELQQRIQQQEKRASTISPEQGICFDWIYLTQESIYKNVLADCLAEQLQKFNPAHPFNYDFFEDKKNTEEYALLHMRLQRFIQNNQKLPRSQKLPATVKESIIALHLITLADENDTYLQNRTNENLTKLQKNLQRAQELSSLLEKKI